ARAGLRRDSAAPARSRQRPQQRGRLGPEEELHRVVTRAPAVVVVLVIELRLPPRLDVDEERVDVDPWAARLLPRLRHIRELAEDHDCVGIESRLLAQLAPRRCLPVLARLHAPRDRVPVAPAVRRAVGDEELVPTADVDQHLAPLVHAGNTTSARAPLKAKLPCSSSATRAWTIERPVPLGAPSAPEPSSAIASRTSASRRTSSIRTVPAPCSSAFCRSSEKTSASAVARLPASDTGSSCAWTSRPAPSPCTSVARNRSISSASSTSSSRCSVSDSCTAAMARIR